MVGPPFNRNLRRSLLLSKPSHQKPTPEAWEPLLRVTRLAARPLERFLAIEAASGIVLLVAAVIALVWANSGWSASYLALWHTPVGIRVGDFAFERTLEWIVNDGLMVIFFFVVGMEIRREVHHGELSELRRAALPAAAALGGMLVPAGIYLTIAGAPSTRGGWGVPMATDIAFALGVFALLGKRVPPALRVLLLALAVIDDLGAIIVIAIFYTANLQLLGLVFAAGGFAGIFVMQRFGIRSRALYIVPALVSWAGIYTAGIHPTIAGVVVGLMTPVRAPLGPEGFLESAQGELARLSNLGASRLSSHDLASSLKQVDLARRGAMAPAESLIESLHPWVAYAIMPIFALANAGVSVGGGLSAVGTQDVMFGVVAGLVIGKTIGVFGVSWLVVRLGIGVLPKGLGPRHLIVLGVVAGVGFTMAIFIAQLAFSDPALLTAAKRGVLLASGAAGVLGLVLGRLLLAPTQLSEAASSADEAESSTEL